MAQNSKQIQTQAQQQLQTLSAQQVLVARLLELPTVELEDRVRAEVLENPALEEGSEELSLPDETVGNDLDNLQEEVTYDDLKDFLTPDDIPDYKLQEPGRNRNEQTEIPFSEATSFYELLKEQLAEQPLGKRMRDVVGYLIGSLDDDGFLRKSLSALIDELLLYMNISTTESELEDALRVIQAFDPAGVGARNLQECLLLQIERNMRKEGADKELLHLEKKIVTKYYEDFTRKNWEKITERTKVDSDMSRKAISEICRLNPRPGASLGEVIGKNMQQIVPDFIVESFDDASITINLNNPHLPPLHVSRDYSRMYEEQNKQSDNKNKSASEALVFIRSKMEAAHGFIEALRTRQETLLACMQTIVELQRPFFQEGDENLLRPMLMKDVAERIGVDVSTVSRVASSKYVQTNYGIYSLKFFFSDTYTNQEGEEISLRQIRTAMLECVSEEDKHNPYTDDELCEMMKEKGFPIARRTVAKYRQQLGIPTARMRRIIL
ncbi:MAG: RNA polymerase factor sigma-54 [Mediterranea massiliensis]|nr:RNA polymerase factor sigma-54 [Mediterranea massiliensis]